jgi:hypothetical protein
MQHCEIESALQPFNESLVRLVYEGGVSNKQSQEKDILQIMKLMACIRTKALETGWDKSCDRDMDEVHVILQCLKKMQE